MQNINNFMSRLPNLFSTPPKVKKVSLTASKSKISMYKLELYIRFQYSNTDWSIIIHIRVVYFCHEFNFRRLKRIVWRQLYMHFEFASFVRTRNLWGKIHWYVKNLEKCETKHLYQLIKEGQIFGKLRRITTNLKAINYRAK